MNIDKFYSYFKENTKIIFIFLILLFIHLYWVNSLNERANIGLKRKGLYKVHHKAQAKIGAELMSSCRFFIDKKPAINLEFELSRLGLGMKLGKNKLYELRNVTFSELKFQTISKANPLVQATSLGYLIENTKSGKCFGVM